MYEIMIWELFILITLVWLLFASISDLRTREVPNWLNFSMIAIGLGGRLIYSIISSNYSIFIYGILGFGIFLIIANILYYAKQWGGGDAKLLMGMGALYGNYQGVSFLNPVLDLPFLLILIINIFIAGTFYGLIYSLYLALKNRNEFVKQLRKESLKEFLFGVSAGVMIIITGFIFYDLIGIIIIIFGTILLLFSIVYLFLKVVEKSCMYKKINISELSEGDWIAEDIKVKNKLVYRSMEKYKWPNFLKYKKHYSIYNRLKYMLKKEKTKYSNLGVSKEDVKRLKNYKVKYVVIKDGIPFVPSFLFGFVATIIYGNLFFLFKAFFLQSF